MKSRFFYSRLAWTNILKNKQIYIPYVISETLTIMMFYLIHSLSINDGLKNGQVGRTMLPIILNLGTGVVMVFSMIFLFYVNSFMIKRRKKEIALYHILGLEKKHIMIMMLYETVMISIFSLGLGIILGALFSRLMFLILVKMIDISTPLYFDIPLQSVTLTMKIYSFLFLVVYLFNVFQIKTANPVTLLYEKNRGEKEPKVKWLWTVLGLIFLISGYALALLIEDPGIAMALFFFAVILVILGTYLLFTTGSIALLKMLRKNKSFYYQTHHFIPISQMIYRMKQNAVGLASICILCTCILVMMSSTISLYISVMFDPANSGIQEDCRITLYTTEEGLPSDDALKQSYLDLLHTFEQEDIELKYYSYYKVYISNIEMYDDKIKVEVNNGHQAMLATFLENYQKNHDSTVPLKEDEVLIHARSLSLGSTITIGDEVFKIKDYFDDPYYLPSPSLAPSQEYIGIIFASEDILKEVMHTQEQDLHPRINISIDYQGWNVNKRANDLIMEIYQEYPGYSFSSQYETRALLMEIFGSLFFLGIFLSALFLMATILIMYYKQLSEGYEDKQRFEIMQHVGMSQDEVKASIRSQILIFFFLPLVVAMLHMAVAFKMIVKMFGYIVASDVHLFAICTVISIIILIIIYSIVYQWTAKVYYHIVK